MTVSITMPQWLQFPGCENSISLTAEHLAASIWSSGGIRRLLVTPGRPQFIFQKRLHLRSQAMAHLM